MEKSMLMRRLSNIMAKSHFYMSLKKTEPAVARLCNRYVLYE